MFINITMRIAYAMKAFCARRHKIYDLMKNDHEIEIYSFKNTRKDIDAPENVHFCAHADRMAERIKDGNFDIVHVFTDETEMAYKIMKNNKIVIDTYDMACLRGRNDPFKDRVYRSKWPKIFASPKYIEWWNNRYNSKEKVWFIPNYPLKKWVDQAKIQEKIEGENIVYYGGLKSAPGSGVGYRFYLPYFKIFADAGINVHVYPVGDRAKLFNYRGKGIILHDKVKHLDIFSELTKYKVGFLGYADKGVKPIHVEYARKCVPNKAFDYMIMGIPSLSYNLGYSEIYIEKWGVCCQDPDELVAGYYRAKGLDLTKIDKEKYYMEQYKKTLNAIYDLAYSL